jgi:hypothetical protein
MSRLIVEGNQWVYHPVNGAKLIWLDKLPGFLRDGWFCTPDDFPPVVVSDGLPELTKKELYDYSKELGLKLEWRVTKDTLISQIEEHLNGNG